MTASGVLDLQSPHGKVRALFHEEAMKSLPRRIAVFFLYTLALSAGLPLGRSHESSDSLYISHVTVTPKSPLCNFLWPRHPTGLPYKVLLLALSLFQILQHCHHENAHAESWDQVYQDVPGVVKRPWWGSKDAHTISYA